MNEINDEIKLTMNLMQTDIDDGAHSELQGHLYSLLEMKRNVIQQRLVERPWSESSKPLTADELRAGGWWCSDVSEDCRLAFIEKDIGTRSIAWPIDGGYNYCYMSGTVVARGSGESLQKNQIHRIGNDFYWSENNG